MIETSRRSIVNFSAKDRSIFPHELNSFDNWEREGGHLVFQTTTESYVSFPHSPFRMEQARWISIAGEIEQFSWWYDETSLSFTNRKFRTEEISERELWRRTCSIFIPFNCSYRDSHLVNCCVEWKFATSSFLSVIFLL